MEIGQIVAELRSLANTGTRMPGFRRKVMVDIDRLSALADELQRSLPSNMQEAVEILKQKDSILNLAFMEAQRIKASAEQEAREITGVAQSRVGESEIIKVAEAKAQEIKEAAMQEAQMIVQDAQRKAYRIINEAEAASISRRDGADNYAREVLFNLEEQLAEVLGQVRRGIDALRIEIEASQKAQNGPQNGAPLQMKVG